MLEQFLSPDFWKSQWAIVMSAPFIIIPLLLLAMFIGSWLRKSVDDGEIRGVKAENNALKIRLDGAHREHDIVSKELAKLRPDVDQLKTDVAELRAANPGLRRFDEVATTTSVVVGRLEVIFRANSTLGSTLSFTGAGYGSGLFTEDKKS